MRSLSFPQSTLLAQRGLSAIWIFKIDWPAPYGTRYYTYRKYKSGGDPISIDPLLEHEAVLTGFPEFLRSVDTSVVSLGVINSAQFTFQNDPADENRIQLIFESLASVRLITVTVYFLLDWPADVPTQSDWTHFGTYRIDNYEFSTDSVIVHIIDWIVTAKEKLVGRLLTSFQTDYPTMPFPGNGVIAPIVIGEHPNSICYFLQSGLRANLRSAITSTTTPIPVTDLPGGFPSSGTIIIAGEKISYAAVNVATPGAHTIGTAGSPVTRGADSTTAGSHVRGTIVRQELATYDLIVADHFCVGVADVRINDLALTETTDYTLHQSEIDEHPVTLIRLLALPLINGLFPFENSALVLAAVEGIQDPYTLPGTACFSPESVFKMLVGVASESGTATGSQTSSTLKDTSQSWTVNQWAGFYARLRRGDTDEEAILIVSNTSDTITIDGTWTSNPVNGVDAYEIISQLLPDLMDFGEDYIDSANLADALSILPVGFRFDGTAYLQRSAFEILNELLFSSALRSVWESGQIRFYSTIEVTAADSLYTFDREDMFNEVEGRFLHELNIINKVELFYGRSFEGFTRSGFSTIFYPLQITEDDLVSQAESWGVRPRRMFADWLQDETSASWLAGRLVLEFSFRRGIFRVSGPFKWAEVEIGDAVSINDEQSRLFNQPGRLVQARFLEPDIVQIDVQIPNRRNRIWQCGAGNHIDLYTGDLIMRIFRGGIQVAGLTASGELWIRGQVIESAFTSETTHSASCSSSGLLEVIGGNISIGTYNAAETSIIQVATIDTSGNLRLYRVIEDDDYPLTQAASPTYAAEYFDYFTAVGSTDFSADLLRTFMRFERTIVSSQTNATLRVKRIRENAF